jgi:hypothetical protein
MIPSVIFGYRRVQVRSSANHYRYPHFQGWQVTAADLCFQVCGDNAADERRPKMAQDHRNDAQRANPQSQVGLTQDELNLIVGGSTDPNDPVGGATGAADVDLKATPILM